jgi:hypothetical protein
MKNCLGKYSIDQLAKKQIGNIITVNNKNTKEIPSRPNVIDISRGYSINIVFIN